MNSNILIDNFSLDDFDYNLPNDVIAQYPNEEREKSKLLVFDKQSNNYTHTTFNNIDNFLPKDSLIVLNSTKVIPARFFMRKKTGGIIELLCIAPYAPSKDPQITMNAKGKCCWECIVGGRNVIPNMILYLDNYYNNNYINYTLKDIDLKAHILSRNENKAIVEFIWNKKVTFRTVLETIGKMPLPPYIRREAENIDKERYQTVYANISGSVAAPTAGLHFSNSVLKSLLNKNINFANIILHVGPGTFVPITTTIEKHKMHFEQIFIDIKTIKKIAEQYSKKNSFVISTGTTSLRTLETLYWVGVKSIKKELELINNEYAVLEQNYAYSLNNNETYSVYEAFNALIEYITKKNINNLECYTQLFIIPGYKIKTINALITNFHLPKSTLLLLVSAFIGIDNCKKIYREALANSYRFLSYGDSSLLINSKN